MAIFASTTTSGYSDPLKAMNIKALEQRLKDQQAQMAAQQPDAASMATIPGGIGHVLGVVGDKMAQGRNEQALAAQRDILAKAVSGYNPDSGPPPAAIATTDPELYKSLLSTWAENRRSAAQIAAQTRGQDLTRESSAEGHGVTRAGNQLQADVAREGQGNQAAMETARLEAAKAAAAEAARVQREAKIDEEQRLANRPASDAAKIMQDVQAGKLTAEQGEALVSKLSAPSATEMKAGNEIQNTYLDTQGALSDLKEARDLLGPEGTGIRAGAGAGMGQIGAKWGGDALGLSDPKLTQKTERFNQIMSTEAINAMAQKLKGASTDYEMRQFVALMNDANAEPKTKMQALNNMIAKAEAHQALQLDQMKRAKVTPPAGLATGGGASAPPKPAGMSDEAILSEAQGHLKNATPEQAAKINARLKAWGLQ